jgi:hypothetical protein
MSLFLVFLEKIFSIRVLDFLIFNYIELIS